MAVDVHLSTWDSSRDEEVEPSDLTYSSLLEQRLKSERQGPRVILDCTARCIVNREALH